MQKMRNLLPGSKKGDKTTGKSDKKKKVSSKDRPLAEFSDDKKPSTSASKNKKTEEKQSQKPLTMSDFTAKKPSWAEVAANKQKQPSFSASSRTDSMSSTVPDLPDPMVPISSRTQLRRLSSAGRPTEPETKPEDPLIVARHSKIAIGCAVKVRGFHEKGVVRWLGLYSDKCMAGLEMERAKSFWNKTQDDKSWFTCRADHEHYENIEELELMEPEKPSNFANRLYQNSMSSAPTSLTRNKSRVVELTETNDGRIWLGSKVRHRHLRTRGVVRWIGIYDDREMIGLETAEKTFGTTKIDGCTFFEAPEGYSEYLPSDRVEPDIESWQNPLARDDYSSTKYSSHTPGVHTSAVHSHTSSSSRSAVPNPTLVIVELQKFGDYSIGDHVLYKDVYPGIIKFMGRVKNGEEDTSKVHVGLDMTEVMPSHYNNETFDGFPQFTSAHHGAVYCDITQISHYQDVPFDPYPIPSTDSMCSVPLWYPVPELPDPMVPISASTQLIQRSQTELLEKSNCSCSKGKRTEVNPPQPQALTDPSTKTPSVANVYVDERKESRPTEQETKPEKPEMVTRYGEIVIGGEVKVRRFQEKGVVRWLGLYSGAKCVAGLEMERPLSFWKKTQDDKSWFTCRAQHEHYVNTDELEVIESKQFKPAKPLEDPVPRDDHRNTKFSGHTPGIHSQYTPSNSQIATPKLAPIEMEKYAGFAKGDVVLYGGRSPAIIISMRRVQNGRADEVTGKVEVCLDMMAEEIPAGDSETIDRLPQFKAVNQSLSCDITQISHYLNVRPIPKDDNLRKLSERRISDTRGQSRRNVQSIAEEPSQKPSSEDASPDPVNARTSENLCEEQRRPRAIMESLIFYSRARGNNNNSINTGTNSQLCDEANEFGLTNRNDRNFENKLDRRKPQKRSYEQKPRRRNRRERPNQKKSESLSRDDEAFENNGTESTGFYVRDDIQENGDQFRIYAGDQSQNNAADQSQNNPGDQSRSNDENQSRRKAAGQCRRKARDQSRRKAGDDHTNFLHNLKEAQEILKWKDLEVNTEVETTGKITVYGVIKWIGYLPNQPVQVPMVGIEMEADSYLGGARRGRHTAAQRFGEYDGHKLFPCTSGRGVFFPAYRLRKDRRPKDISGTDEVQNMYDAPKSAIVQENQCVAYWPRRSEHVLGRFKGIQGHHNSCYLDATLYSMFAFTHAFDSLLHRPELSSDITEYTEIQTILREKIVNPLRRDHYVDAQKVKELRTLLEKLCAVNGMTGEAEDPEEFLNSLLNETLKADPFIKLSSGQESFFYQLVFENTENFTQPTTQELIDMSFEQSQIKLKEAPSCLIVQMPRAGRMNKMFDKIVPSPEIDITTLIERHKHKCCLCRADKYEWFTCHDCGMQNKSAVDYCYKCWREHQQNVRHKDHRGYLVSGAVDEQMMELFSVVCVETSHYVTFTKCGPQKWVFFDSMADRSGDQHGFNIPEVNACMDVGESSEMLLFCNDVSLARRVLQDAYLCFYRSVNTSMYY